MFMSQHHTCADGGHRKHVSRRYPSQSCPDNGLEHLEGLSRKPRIGFTVLRVTFSEPCLPHTLRRPSRQDEEA